MKRSALSTFALSILSLGCFALGSGAYAIKTEPIKDLAIKGERYEAEVPDTLDLAERAELSLEGLLAWCEDRDIHPDGSASPLHPNRGVLGPKYLETLPMIRVMSGTEKDLAREKKAVQGYIDETGDDGLFYTPPLDPMPEPWASVYGQSRLQLAWMAYAQLYKDPVYKELLDKLTRKLLDIAVVKGDYAYYPTELIENAYFVFSIRKSGWENKDEPEPHHKTSENQVLTMATRDGHQFDSKMGIPCYIGGALRAMGRYYEMTGDQQTFDITTKIIKFVARPDMWQPYQSSSSTHGGMPHAHYSGHLHAHTIALRSFLDFARATNNSELAEFVRDGYEYTRSFGIPTIGWIPEWTNNNACEGCQVADIVALALRLSELNIGDYWDDADRIVRNMMCEMQQTKPGSPVLGKFAAAASIASMMNGDGSSCCTPNCAEALYYTWHDMLSFKDGVAQVNLWFNRASPWMDVDSYLPYEGKLVLKNKQAKAALVRIPKWANLKEVKCSVDGKSVTPIWNGRYVLLSHLSPNSVVTIEVPIKTYSVQFTPLMSGSEGPDGKPNYPAYKATFKGNTVIDMEPKTKVPDNAIQFYQRDHYKADKAPMVKKTRYVSDVIMDW